MKIIAFIEEEDTIRQILKHLGLWLPGNHDPPEQKTCPAGTRIFNMIEMDFDTSLQAIREEIIYYLDADDGYLREQIDMIDPASYDLFMLYVDNIDWVKSEVINSIKVADISAVKEGADILQEINRDLVYVLDLLKNQQYEKAGTAIGNLNFDKAEKFIEKQSAQLSASAN
jgi:hypothetical protein